jgi:hypothetical protein
LSKRENIDEFVLPLSLGNPQPGIHRKGFHPSAEKLNPQGRIGNRGLSLVNTPTFTWAYTRTEGIQRKGSVTNQMGIWDAVYLNESKKIGYEKCLQ